VHRTVDRRAAGHRVAHVLLCALAVVGCMAAPASGLTFIACGKDDAETQQLLDRANASISDLTSFIDTTTRALGEYRPIAKGSVVFNLTLIRRVNASADAGLTLLLAGEMARRAPRTPALTSFIALDKGSVENMDVYDVTAARTVAIELLNRGEGDKARWTTIVDAAAAALERSNANLSKARARTSQELRDAEAKRTRLMKDKAGYEQCLKKPTPPPPEPPAVLPEPLPEPLPPVGGVATRLTMVGPTKEQGGSWLVTEFARRAELHLPAGDAVLQFPLPEVITPGATVKLEGSVDAKAKRLDAQIDVQAPSQVQILNELGTQPVTPRLVLSASPGTRAIGSFTFKVVLAKGLTVGTNVVLRVVLSSPTSGTSSKVTYTYRAA
jgi:hypothetical protein